MKYQEQKKIHLNVRTISLAKLGQFERIERKRKSNLKDILEKVKMKEK